MLLVSCLLARNVEWMHKITNLHITHGDVNICKLIKRMSSSIISVEIVMKQYNSVRPTSHVYRVNTSISPGQEYLFDSCQEKWNL
jgi:hypothetical protein